MKVWTVHWGVIECEYWRSDEGREGLRAQRKDLPASILPGDLANPGDWGKLMWEGAATFSPKVAVPAAKVAAATPEVKADKAALERLEATRAKRTGSARIVWEKDGAS